ncbi:MAG: alpha/beta fold hydrolase [Acidimicrobiales bacterium]
MPAPSDEPTPPPPAATVRPVATERVPSTDGVVLALHDLGGSGPTVLFCHPTGFLGMTWAPLAAALADRAHCWALDFRGHGDSTLPGPASLDWQHMADDVLAVVDHLDATPLYGVGHSMGGAALALTEELRPGLWAGLWFYEPILFPRFDGESTPIRPDRSSEIRPDAGSLPQPATNPMANGARRRKAVFPDRATARLNYSSKLPLRVLHPAALDAYVAYGFRDRSDGSVELKCDPEVEARTFEGSGGGHDIFAGLGSVRCPTTVAAGGDGSPPARMAPLVAEALPHGRFERMAQLTHFGPMEDPAAVAASIAPILTADL